MTTEALTQQKSALLIEELHGRAWRNNSGAYQDEHGNFIRYGLNNESKKVNEKVKSSDLICIVPTLITPQMVGYHLGVFTALEIKRPGWKLLPSDKRGEAQARFHQIVRNACGFAGFVTHTDDVLRIIGRG